MAAPWLEEARSSPQLGDTTPTSLQWDVKLANDGFQLYRTKLLGPILTLLFNFKTYLILRLLKSHIFKWQYLGRLTYSLEAWSISHVLAMKRGCRDILKCLLLSCRELSHFNHLFTSTLKRISLLQHKKDKHQPQQQLFFGKQIWSTPSSSKLSTLIFFLSTLGIYLASPHSVET